MAVHSTLLARLLCQELLSALGSHDELDLTRWFLLLEGHQGNSDKSRKKQDVPHSDEPLCSDRGHPRVTPGRREGRSCGAFEAEGKWVGQVLLVARKRRPTPPTVPPGERSSGQHLHDRQGPGSFPSSLCHPGIPLVGRGTAGPTPRPGTAAPKGRTGTGLPVSVPRE